MTEILTIILLFIFALSHGYENNTQVYMKLLSDSTYADKRTLPSAGCQAPAIDNSQPIRAESMPPSSGTWTYPIYCKPGYSLIGPCRLVCRETVSPGVYNFAPPNGLEMPTCVKDYAASQFNCHYLSSACPLVWDYDADPAKPSIAISRIFCGQILASPGPNVLKVYGFAASIYATTVAGNLCEYKGGIKNDRCYIVKGQRNVPVARGNDLPAITYLGNLDGYEALSGAEDPYIGKLSRKAPYYLFPPDVTPSTLVSRLREYFSACKERHGFQMRMCMQMLFLTSTLTGYDVHVAFGSDDTTSGILDAFPVRPTSSCIAKRCCCDLNGQSR